MSSQWPGHAAKPTAGRPWLGEGDGHAKPIPGRPWLGEADGYRTWLDAELRVLQSRLVRAFELASGNGSQYSSAGGSGSTQPTLSDEQYDRCLLRESCSGAQSTFLGGHHGVKDFDADLMNLRGLQGWEGSEGSIKAMKDVGEVNEEASYEEFEVPEPQDEPESEEQKVEEEHEDVEVENFRECYEQPNVEGDTWCVDSGLHTLPPVSVKASQAATFARPPSQQKELQVEEEVLTPSPSATLESEIKLAPEQPNNMPMLLPTPSKLVPMVRHPSPSNSPRQRPLPMLPALSEPSMTPSSPRPMDPPRMDEATFLLQKPPTDRGVVPMQRFSTDSKFDGAEKKWLVGGPDPAMDDLRATQSAKPSLVNIGKTFTDEAIAMNWGRLTLSLLRCSTLHRPRECWLDDISAKHKFKGFQQPWTENDMDVVQYTWLALTTTRGPSSLRGGRISLAGRLGRSMRGSTYSPTRASDKGSFNASQPVYSSGDHRHRSTRWRGHCENFCLGLKTQLTKTIDPACSAYLLWVSFSLLGLCFDVFSMTMRAFGFPVEHIIMKVIEMCVGLYWTLDIVVTFRTGMYKNMDLISSPTLIAKKYFQGWFFFDVSLVILGWIGLALDLYGQDFVKEWRLARYLRMLRCAKLDQVQQKLLVAVSSDCMVLVVKVSLYVAWIVLWVHTSACAWYLVGTRNDEGWVRQNGVPETLPGNYVVSVHWAIAQMQGNIDVFPGVLVPEERAFAALHILVSVIALATFVSKLTTAMQARDANHAIKNREVNLARTFCKGHQISTPLSQRVTQYIEWKQQVNTAGGEHETDLMAILPLDLRRSLLDEVRSPMLLLHVIFLAFQTSHWRFFRCLSADSLVSESYLPGVNIFSFGVVCERMYFITHGHTNYLHYNPLLQALTQNQNQRNMANLISIGYGQDTEVRENLLKHFKPRKVTKETCLCEATLWTHWVHAGDCTSGTHLSLLSLGNTLFESLLNSYPSVQADMRAHSERFVNAVNHWPSELTDLLSSAEVMQKAHEIEPPAMGRTTATRACISQFTCDSSHVSHVSSSGKVSFSFPRAFSP